MLGFSETFCVSHRPVVGGLTGGTSVGIEFAVNVEFAANIATPLL
jgi:hypothetical protein